MEGESARGGDVEQPEPGGTWVACNDGCLSPSALDGQGLGTGNRRQAIPPIRVVINRCQRIGPCLQANPIRGAVRIGVMDRVNQALHVSGATMKGFGPDHGRPCQSEPEEHHSRDTPGEAPPPPFARARRRL